MAGVLDCGEVHAANSFLDKENERVLLLWTCEDDNQCSMKARGWQGSLVLPRHLSVCTLENVTAHEEDVTSPGDWIATKNTALSTVTTSIHSEEPGNLRRHLHFEETETWTAKGLGITPIPDVTKLSHGATHHILQETTPNQGGHQKIANLDTNHCELKFTVDLEATAADSVLMAGFTLRGSADGTEESNMWCDHDNQEFHVDRTKSSAFAQFNSNPEVAKFRLWRTMSGLEKMNVRIFVDAKVKRKETL